MLDGCARCGDDDAAELTAFDLDEGGSAVPAVCARARVGRVSPTRSTCCGGCSAAASTACSPSRRTHASHEVERLGIRALEHHVERRLRSTALL